MTDLKKQRQQEKESEAMLLAIEALLPLLDGKHDYIDLDQMYNFHIAETNCTAQEAFRYVLKQVGLAHA